MNRRTTKDQVLSLAQLAMLCDPRALTPRRSALISATACGLMARKRKENEQGEQHLDAAVDKAEETAGNVIDTAEAAATMAVEAGADIARKAKKILKGATRTVVSSGGKAAAAATEKAAEGTAVAVDIAADVVEKVIDVAADASEVALEKGSELAADAAEVGATIIEQTARKGGKLTEDALDIAANVGASAASGAATAAEAVKGTAEATGRKAGEAVAVAHDKLWPTYGMFVAAIVGKAFSSAAGKGRNNVLDDDWFRGHVINRTWELLPLPVRLAGKDTLRWEQVMFKLRDQVLTKDEDSMAISSNDKSAIRSAIELMLGRKG